MSNFEAIEKIIKRVFDADKVIYPGDRIDLALDLEHTDKVIPLDFDRLIEFPDGDFYHDILGIYRHFDTEAKVMKDCFLPRCSKPSVIKEVDNIGDVPSPKTARMIAQCLTKAPEGDNYHRNIIVGAISLVEANLGYYRYLTQYGSGRCLWESKACTEANPDRVTVYTHGLTIEF
jgi:hypothetical protein